MLSSRYHTDWPYSQIRMVTQQHVWHDYPKPCQIIRHWIRWEFKLKLPYCPVCVKVSPLTTRQSRPVTIQSKSLINRKTMIISTVSVCNWCIHRNIHGLSVQANQRATHIIRCERICEGINTAWHRNVDKSVTINPIATGLPLRNGNPARQEQYPAVPCQ